MKCENCIHYGVCIVNSYCHEPCGYYEEDRPHGEWKKKTDGVPHLVTIEWFVCSECGVQKSEETPFCPNCGASMRVKNELSRVSKELNGEIEKSKSEIVPDYRDGWRLKEGEANE